MRPDRLYLTDILEAAAAIGRFIDGVDRATFLGNELVQSAVLQKLTIIGEAAVRLARSETVRSADPTLEWSDIIGFRNIVVHAYFAVQWSTLWVTATKDVPVLTRRVSAILETLAATE